MALVKAKREDRRTEQMAALKNADWMNAHLIASIGNLLYGSEADPAPFKPSECQAFKWDEEGKTQPAPEIEIDDEIDMVALMEQKKINDRYMNTGRGK